MLTQATKFGAELQLAEVRQVVPSADTKMIRTSKGDIMTKAVIITSGSHSRKIGVPGEEEFINKGVFYCAICDGPRFTGKVVAVAGGFLVVGPPQIEKMPIRPINFTTPNAERKQLLKQSTELYKKYMESQDWSDILAVLEQWLPTKADGSPDTEHEHSDMVHDLLAFLAEEMTRLNKEKQSKIKAFSSWLEKEILKGSVEDQKNKTKIKDFYNTTFEDLLDVLKKDKIVSDPYPLDKRNILENEFNAALTVINPLRDKIKLTDGLIDQTVYKLYGLTKEEIQL